MEDVLAVLCRSDSIVSAQQILPGWTNAEVLGHMQTVIYHLGTETRVYSICYHQDKGDTANTRHTDFLVDSFSLFSSALTMENLDCNYM